MRLTVRLLGEFAVEVDNRLVLASAWNRRSAAALALRRQRPAQSADAWIMTVSQ